jgi:hypothetical protein
MSSLIAERDWKVKIGSTTPGEVEQHWDLEIKPKDKLFNLHLKDVWNYRDLLWLLVRRDFVAFYKQTIFGPLWFFIQPGIYHYSFHHCIQQNGWFWHRQYSGTLILFMRDCCLELFFRMPYENQHNF